MSGQFAAERKEMILNPDGTPYETNSGSFKIAVSMAIDQCNKVALSFLGQGLLKEKNAALLCANKVKALTCIKNPDDLVYMQELMGTSGNMRKTHGYFSRGDINGYMCEPDKSKALKLRREDAEAYESKYSDYYFVIEDV